MYAITWGFVAAAFWVGVAVFLHISTSHTPTDPASYKSESVLP